MSFTVVIKDNESGKIFFASEKTRAIVVGAVAEEGSAENPATSLAACCSSHVDMALAIGLAREAVTSVEKQDPELRGMGLAAEAFLMMKEKKAKKAKKAKKEGGEDD